MEEPMPLRQVYCLALCAFISLVGCSTEEHKGDEQSAVDQESRSDEMDLNKGKHKGHSKQDNHGKKKPKPPKDNNPEAGESATCAAHKQAIANQGIFIHSSGYRIRFINMRLSFSDAEVACANSSTVATLAPATEEQLLLFDDLFITEDGEECPTDVFADTGERFLMPGTIPLKKGSTAKVICVVQE
jgi:hypothetical protein